MDKRKTYWIWGCIIAVLLILAIIWLVTSNSRKNGSHSMDGHTENGSTSSAENSEAVMPDSTGTEFEAVDPLQQYLAEQDSIMTDMMADMEVSPSGSAAIDFLRGMIPHHESAIDMAESYLKYGGTNETLKEIAENIIRTQSDEIEQMKTLIQEIIASGETDTEKEDGYLNGYNKMISGHAHMHHGASQAGDVEQAFAEGMLMHHQMAVDMSKAILDYTDHAAVKELAETIIQAQEEEIDTMQNVINGTGSKSR